MLGGLDPILIFHLWKLTDSELESVSKVPLVSSIVNKIGLPPIPVYLSEKATGLYIDSEEKNIDIETSTETLSSGDDPIVNQKAIGSTIRVNMIARKDSIGLILLSAVMDLIVPKVTSREYGITYLHGSTTVFNGLLHTFAVTANADNELLNLTMELTKSSNKTQEKQKVPKVEPVPESLTLESGMIGTPPTAPLPTSAPLGSSLPTGPATSSPPVSLGGPG